MLRATGRGVFGEGIAGDRQIDAIGADRLPPDLAGGAAVRDRETSGRRASTAPRLALAQLAVLAELRTQLVAGSFPQNATEVLQRLFPGRSRSRRIPGFFASAAASTGGHVEAGRGVGGVRRQRPATLRGRVGVRPLAQFAERTRFEAKRENGALKSFNGWIGEHLL
jgi:hypothetical protein